MRRTSPTKPAEIASLASSKHLASLVALDIERCDLGKNGLAAFLEALHLPALEALIAASNNFGRIGKVLLNECDSDDARNALANSKSLAKTTVYFRGKMIAKAKPGAGAEEKATKTSTARKRAKSAG